jgi:putative endopeptidase
MKSGLDLNYVKSSIRPQDDLFRHVNGLWLDSFEIPADKPGYSSGSYLFDKAESQVREIIEGLDSGEYPTGSEEQKIRDLFKSFMNEAAIEAAGCNPVLPDVERALNLKDLAEFHSILGNFEYRGLGGLFYQYVNTDDRDSTTYITNLGQSGLSLPDEAYYREDQYAPLREGLVAHIEAMFGLAGITNGRDHATRILDLETKIASHHWDQVKCREAELTYNKFSLEQLQQISSPFDWSAWLESSKTPRHVVETSIVHQPTFFEGIGKMLAQFDREAWSSWLAWHALSSAAPYLSSDFVNQNFAFYGTTLSGTPELRVRWKRAVALIEGALGEAVGKIYVARHFPTEAKARMDQLVANLLEAYRVSIKALDWMSEETKVSALQKLELFTPKIGYPDKWRDYSALEIHADDLIGNLNRINAFTQMREYSKIGKPVDRSEWFMTPQTVNAYYNPGMNEIVFPAAILQPPFFDVDGDDAANYGAIGAVIGHEIGHGFDDQGSKYDGYGNMNDWWSETDRTEFEARAANLIAQYDELFPVGIPDMHVNGALTVGENIGDLGGLTIAILAYKISLAGQPSPVIEGLTGVQRAFFSWAVSWRAKLRPELARLRLSTDPHSPNEFRCNQIVRNLDEFYEGFSVTQSDELYLPPESRVRIW